jgi:hypothetical protein
MIFDYFFRRKPVFSASGITITTRFPDGTEAIIPHLEPLVDENCLFTGFIGIATKGGTLSKPCADFIKRYRKKFVFIWLTCAGPYFYENFERLFAEYDAITALDCPLPLDLFHDKLLYLNYSMMTRCGPLPGGFFWEPPQRRDADFSILTWFDDTVAKVWPHARMLTLSLCDRGYRGILVTQRGTAEDMLDAALENHVRSGLLELHTGNLNERDFAALIGRAKFGIFPNQQDAFPKHIMECLLLDKPIIISEHLLFGKKTLENLGADIVCAVDLDAGGGGCRFDLRFYEYAKSVLFFAQKYLAEKI